MTGFNKNKYVFSKSPSSVKNDEISLKTREKQISLLVKEIYLYKVLLKDLVVHIPTDDQKNVLLNIAYYVVENEELFSKFEKTRLLPVGVISKHTHIDSSFIESWQEYIITYIIILSNPNYKLIQDYFKVEYKEQHQKNSKNYNGLTLIEKPKSVGLIIEIDKKSNIILTSDGRFIKIEKKQEQESLGEEVYGIPKKIVKNVGLKVSVVFMFIVFIIFFAYKQYTTPKTTIIISSEIQVKYELNRFDKVVYTYSQDDTGKELIYHNKPMDKNIDTAIKECIEYYNDNELISATGILITVNGVPIEYGKLQNTGDYIVDNNIKVLINNCGNQNKLSDNILRQREEDSSSSE